MQPIAFFTRISDDSDSPLMPGRYARSLWAPGTLNGPAVCALAARAAEQEFRPDGFRPARFTIDLFKVAREVPTATRGRLIRHGGRIKVAEVDVVQFPDGHPGGDGIVVARSTTVFVRESTDPPGRRWQRPASDVRFAPPETSDDDYYPWFGSETDPATGDTAWDQDMGAHQDARRKRLWTRALSVVDGEAPTAFERGVIGAESSSLINNWGDTGIGFINCDLTVTFARLPIGLRVGVEADTHLEQDGISTSTAALYDTEGQFGVGMVTGVNNAAAQIDFTAVETSGRYREG